MLENKKLAMKDTRKYSQPRSTFLQYSVHATKYPFLLTCENRISYTVRVVRDFFSKSLLDASFRHSQDMFKVAPLRMPPLLPRKAGAVI